MHADMGDVKPRIDGRTRQAKLIAAISEPEVQAAALRRLAAALVSEIEFIEKRQSTGEVGCADQLVRAGNSLRGTLELLNALLPNKKYWLSQKEAQERDERTAYLETLSDQELRALKCEVSGIPYTEPTSPSVPDYLSEPALSLTRAAAQRAHEARTDSFSTQKKSEHTPEEGTDLDDVLIQSLISVLR